jgi:hypothetical protein
MTAATPYTTGEIAEIQKQCDENPAWPSTHSTRRWLATLAAVREELVTERRLRVQLAEDSQRHVEQLEQMRQERDAEHAEAEHYRIEASNAYLAQEQMQEKVAQLRDAAEAGHGLYLKACAAGKEWMERAEAAEARVVALAQELEQWITLAPTTAERIAALTQALHRFGVHWSGCPYAGTTARVGPQDQCSCGLRAALAEGRDG